MTAATPAAKEDWHVHAAFVAVSTLACLVWSWLAGRDLNWDQLNYHFYSAYQLLDGRIDRDFMAASVQGYLNPLAQVPFFLMVRANWHSLLIGSTLALMHSTCLWLVYGISGILIPPSAPHRTLVLAGSVTLAFLAPVFLVEVGSSFADVTTTIPVLGAVWLLLVHHRRGGGIAPIVTAGLLMGAATGLKLTNAIFAVTASVFVIAAAAPIVERIKALATYTGGGLVGFVALEGMWSYRLYESFGSPFFPFFNTLFKSPDFPAFDLRHTRFIPETVSDYLLFPVRMLDLHTRIYTESISPDVRFVALFAILVAVGFVHLARRARLRAATASGGGTAASANGNKARGLSVFAAALTFTLLSYLLWLRISGNGRYALPLELFIAPMIPASLLAIGNAKRVLIYVTGAVLIVQALMTYAIGPSRWMSVQWKATWFDLELPDALKDHPFLFLSLSKQPAAFLAPFLHRDSSFVNMLGQVSLALDRPGGARLQTLLDRHRGQVRTLLMPTISVNRRPLPERVVSFQNHQLSRVGLEVDESNCIVFAMHDLAGLAPTTYSQSTAADGSRVRDTNTYFLSCGTKPLDKSHLDPQLAERRKKADQAFDLLEKTCPKLFSPAGIYTNHLNQMLLRDYVNTDAFLSELNGTVEYEGWRYSAPVTLGSVDDIIDRKVRIECGLARSPPVAIPIQE